MNAMIAREQSLSLWGERIHPRVLIGGEGPPLVFLHGAGGLLWDGFLDELAKVHTVYAPEFPGTSPGDYEAIKALDDWHDLVVYYAELLDALGLSGADLVGHSFGGMIAAEMAAANPGAVGRLALLAPLGLWRDDAPIPPWLTMNSEEMAEVFFHDPDIAARFMLTPELAAAQPDILLAATWSLACASKFTWPIPDRGLRDRLHRISAPTLLLWGDKDRLVSPAYAEDFQAGLSDAQLALIPNAGHALIHERPSETARAIVEFMKV